MSTPPPAPSLPQDDSKDEPLSDDSEKSPPETEQTSEEEILGPDEEAPSLDDEEEASDTDDKAASEDDAKSGDEAADEAMKEEKKPRKKRGDRKKRKKDRKESSSEDTDKEASDKETSAKRKKPEKPEKPKEPQKPKSYKKASPEIQAYMDQLQDEEQQLENRNKYLIGAVGGTVLLLLISFWIIRSITTGSYAVLDNIEIGQDPIDKGLLRIKYDVIKPGKVRCCRTSGSMENEQMRTYSSAGNAEWSWSHRYQPGGNIDITIEDRGWLSRRKFTRSFPTTLRTDVVLLVDTTRSMGSVIAQLGEKGILSLGVSARNRGLKTRYALVGFGDYRQRGWVDDCPFTPNLESFLKSIQNVARLNGGGSPNSALDALEKAMSLKLEKNSNRCFYLVTDAPYLEPTQSGKTAEEIAEQLKKRRVILRVFSRPEYEDHYARVLGETGRFMPIQSLGQVMSEGRILGD